MEIVRVTVRVPRELRDELKALQAEFPKRGRPSQHDIVGALVHEATVAKVRSALVSYDKALEEWERRS
jgi:hypothetical protein